MTSNPNWSEIKEQLKYNDEAENRLDLIARIFRAKLEQLKKDTQKRIFGWLVAHIYIIEFQKIGFPHAHFLLLLKNDCKITYLELIDKFVSAEISDKIQYPYLHSLVIKDMMHGPCGVLNSKNVCMNNKNKCRFGFPKIFSENTIIDEKCYPKYK